MIEVIKHGKLRKCECVFTFEKEDIETVQTGQIKFEKAVECPECEERNMVIL